MYSMLRRFGLYFMLFIMLTSILAPIFPVVPATAQETGQKDVARVALVKLWSVSYETYMAKFFYGPDGKLYLAVFGSHGDVSLNGKYVCVLGGKTVYIYDVKSGSLVKQFTADADGDCWDIWTGAKIWDRSGFFSADSSKLIEDVEAYGTDAMVVDLLSGTTTSIDWGFSDTTTGHFYAAQLDYSGSTLAVGYIYTGTLYVFKLVGNTYEPILKYTAGGNYGRRIQMTLDGRYILVGGLNYGYLDIWKESGGTYVRVVHYELPDSGGIGALGISNPYNVSYVIIGTYNGWVIIGYFDTTNDTFKVLYKDKLAPDSAWFYNPFYERYIPKVTEVFALASKAGVGVVYDVLTNTTKVINYGGTYGEWKAAAISPDGQYVFLGNTLYLVVRRDVQSKHPRVRFWGTIEDTLTKYPLSQPLVLAGKTRNYHMYFYSGRIIIRNLYLEEVPTELVQDQNIQKGRLALMLARHLIYPETFYTKYAEVKSVETVQGKDFEYILREHGITTLDNFIATKMKIHYTPPPYFVNGEAWIGTVIKIPLSTPMEPYHDIRLISPLIVHTSTLLYDKNARALAVLGVPMLIGSLTGTAALTKATASRIADSILAEMFKHEMEALGKEVSEEVLKEIASTATKRTLVKVAGVVGIAIAVWGAVDAVLTAFGGLGEIGLQSWVLIVPVFVDNTGIKYAAVTLYLPAEEMGNENMYANIFIDYLKSLGYKPAISIRYPCATWNEYNTLLASGWNPKPKIDELALLVQQKYGVDMNKLTIQEIDIIIVTAMRTKEGFWEWFFGLGGVDVMGVTLVGSASISVKGYLKHGEVKDPVMIARMVKYVTINGKVYELKPGSDGAYADFAIQMGADKLSIVFGKPRGYYADVSYSINVMVKKDFEPLGTYGYYVDINYKDFAIKLDRIELVDMPYPMIKAERIFISEEGGYKLIDDITDKFELQTTNDDPSSPTGKYYYYVTIGNVEWIDPVNKNVLEEGKRFIIRYYYKTPPDAWIDVKFDNAAKTSTYPRKVIVAVGSHSVAQKIKYKLVVKIEIPEENNKYVAIFEETDYGSATVSADGVVQHIYDVTRYVESAQQLMKIFNKSLAVINITATILEYEYNSLETNDRDSVVFLVTPDMPVQPPEGNYTVMIRVFKYDRLNYKWIPCPNATVTAIHISKALTYNVTTNENGTALLELPAGTWTFIARYDNATGSKTVEVNRDMEINIYLYVREFAVIIKVYEPENITKTNVTWKPAVNATVLVYKHGTVSSLEEIGKPYYKAVTDETGTVKLTLEKGNWTFVAMKEGAVASTTVYIDNATIVELYLLTKKPYWSDNHTVTVHVYEYVNDTWVDSANAIVTVYKIEDDTKTLVANTTTNTAGIATFILPTGLYEFNATKGNATDVVRIFILNDTTIELHLVATKLEKVVSATPQTSHTLYVYVYERDWENNTWVPSADADVRVYNATTLELYAESKTLDNGTAIFTLPTGNYTVIVSKLGVTRSATVSLSPNDLYAKLYFYLPINQTLLGNHTVIVKVYECKQENGLWVWVEAANATVLVYNTTTSELEYKAETNTSGIATFILPTGTWTFEATKENATDKATVYVNYDITIPLYLSPTNVTEFNETTLNITGLPLDRASSSNMTGIGGQENSNVTTSTYIALLTFHVYDAVAGKPIQGANITLSYYYQDEIAPLIRLEPSLAKYINVTTITDSEGEAIAETLVGYYNMTVNATGYRPYIKYIVAYDTYEYNIALIPLNVSSTDYALLQVEVVYEDGAPVHGANVTISNGTYVWSGITSSFGDISFFLLKNANYTITVSYVEGNKSYTNTTTITLTTNTTVKFVVPWVSSHPPFIAGNQTYYVLMVEVLYADGMPFEGAVIDIYNATSGEEIISNVTDSTGVALFILPAFNEYLVNITAVYNNETFVYPTAIYLDRNMLLIVKVPWSYLPKNYTAIVYAYNPITGAGYSNIQTVIMQGATIWSSLSNTTGYATIRIPFLGTYNITANKEGLYPVSRINILLYTNNSLVNLPLLPVYVPQELRPPINNTGPAINVGDYNYYWLAIGVFYRDGFPFAGANVTISYGTGNITLKSDISGLAFFLVPVNKTVTVYVDAVVGATAWHFTKTLNMTQHYYLVFTLDQDSSYFHPEVMLKSIKLYIHKATSAFDKFAPLVVMYVWTNMEQDITISLGALELNTDEWLDNTTVTTHVVRGLNKVYGWVEIPTAINHTLRIRVFANITGWEYDTVVDNNWMWSNVVEIYPYFNITVFVLWHPIQQRVKYAILPDDVIEVDIGIILPYNTTNISAKFEWKIMNYDLKAKEFKSVKFASEELKTITGGIAWRNVTVKVPWTNKLEITINITHPWASNATVRQIIIPIDPDVKLEIVSKPVVVVEGSKVKIVAKIVSNVAEDENRIGWVTVICNTTDQVVKQQEVVLAPEKEVEFEFNVLENPTMWGPIKKPVTTVEYTVKYAGYDMYEENNMQTFKVTVVSYQWAIILALIIIVIAAIAIISAVTHTIIDIRMKRMKFVKRKRRPALDLDKAWGEKEDHHKMKFVRRKK